MPEYSSYNKMPNDLQSLPSLELFWLAALQSSIPVSGGVMVTSTHLPWFRFSCVLLAAMSEREGGSFICADNAGDIMTTPLTLFHAGRLLLAN